VCADVYLEHRVQVLGKKATEKDAHATYICQKKTNFVTCDTGRYVISPLRKLLISLNPG